MAEGLRVEQVAEVIVGLADGPGRRGSGYLVAEGRVLTAAHVVAGASEITVRFDADRPGESSERAEVAWSHAGIDVAVLTLPFAAVAPSGRVGRSTRFGRVAERDAVLACSAAGFPRFKMRADQTDQTGQADQSAPPSITHYRDLEHVRATCAVLSNRREGTFDLAVPHPAAPAEPDVSPWQGMSGAALFSQGVCIGVIARHHLADGLGRLAASRVDRWSEQLTADEWQQLEALLGSGITIAELVDASPLQEPIPVRAALEAQLAAFAPEDLLDRHDELRDLVRFCAGDEQYLWLQGPPWAGKTALMATFAQHPPPGVVPVWFFATRQFARHDDSQAYLDAVLAQLSDLAGLELSRDRSAAVRQGEFRRLLDEAAKMTAEQDRVLLLMVDGLDEDRYLALPPGRRREPSISSLLPADPPPNLRVLVTSRPGPGVPGDVRGSHPLRECRVRQLAPVSSAQHTRHEAHRELEAALADPLGRDLVGLLAAARGSFSARDLQELTGADGQEVQHRLKSDFGRTLISQKQADDRRGYIFAHATLLEAAQAELRDRIDDYWTRVTAWARGYAGKSWPADTPVYLLSDIGRMAADRKEFELLLDLAGNSRRTLLMRTITGNDAAALDELSTAEEGIWGGGDIDGGGDGERGRETEAIAASAGHPATALENRAALAAARHVIGARNAGLHPDLPVALASLGRFGEARALSRSIRVPELRACTLAGVAAELARSGRHTAAVELAGQALDLIRSSRAEGILIGADERAMLQVAGSDDEILLIPDIVALMNGDSRAPRTNSWTPIEDLRRQVASDAARALAAAGEFERVREIAMELVDGDDLYSWACVHAEAARSTGPDSSFEYRTAHLIVVERTTDDLSPELRVDVLRRLAGVHAPQSPEARRLYDRIVALARHSDDTGLRASCAFALRQARPETAVTLAREAQRRFLRGLRIPDGMPFEWLVFWAAAMEQGALCIRALAAVDLLEEATRTRDALEEVYAELREINRWDLRTGRSWAGEVLSPDQYRTDAGYAIAAGFLRAGLGMLAGQTLRQLWADVPAARWQFGAVRDAFADLPQGPDTTTSINTLLNVIRPDAESAPWAIAELLVAMARQLAADDHEASLALLTEARTLAVGEGRETAARPTNDRCRADLATALAVLGRADDVRQALQDIRDPLIHDLAYLDADFVGDPAMLRRRNDSVSEPFLMAAAVERLARNGESESAIGLVQHIGFPQAQRAATVAGELWPHDPAGAKRVWKTAYRKQPGVVTKNGAALDRTISLALLLAAARGRYDRGARRVLRDLHSTAVEAADQDWPQCLLLLALAVCPDDRDASARWLAAAEQHRRLPASRRTTDWITVHALTQAALGRPIAAAETAAQLADGEEQAEAQALVAGYLVGIAHTPISSRLRLLTPQFLHPALKLLAHIPPPATGEQTARALVAKVFRTSHWHQALPALAALDPAAVLRTRDALFDAS